MQEVIKKENIIVSWILWHFWEVPKFLVSVWNNYLFFSLNLFSVVLLLKTLFSPWRMGFWIYPKNFDIKGYFSVFISNMFSRIVGAIMRVFLIIFGSIFSLFVFVFGLIVILFWLLSPFIILFFIIYLL